MPDSGYRPKFARRKIRGPVMRNTPVPGLLESFLHRVAGIYQAMPRAWKRLLETGMVAIILIILAGLYLGAVSRSSRSALEGLGKTLRRAPVPSEKGRATGR